MIFLKIAIRTIRKNRLFFSINLMGLSLGMAMLLVILNYAFFEYSYDSFHYRGEDIYRVTMDEYEGEALLNEYAITYSAVGPALQEAYAEVEDYVRLYTESTYGPVIFSHLSPDGERIKFTEKGTYYADKSFFSLFSFELLQGDPDKVLDEMYSVVITERAANKYFRGEEPLGKVLKLHDRGGEKELLVKGVAKDPPLYSHIQFDFIISYNSLGTDEWSNSSWDFNDFTTYLRLAPGANPETLEGQFKELLAHHKGTAVEQEALQVRLNLQPLEEIHLSSNRIQELSANGDGGNIRKLLISACLIILISWMNYINLSTAMATQRAREVGIRKILGSARKQLIRQFLFEAAVINLLAILLAVISSEMILSMLSAQLTDTPVRSLLFELTRYGLMYKGVILLLLFLGILASGLYPAFFMTSFQPFENLRGGLSTYEGKAFRNALVSVQFTLTFILCSFMFAVFQQISFMKESELGFDMENVLVMEAPRVLKESATYEESLSAFRQELMSSAYIETMTASTLIPGKPHNWSGEIKRADYEHARNLPVYFNGVDYEFAEQFQLQLLSGRNFSREYAHDPHKAVILNESAIKLLKFENADKAIGEQVVLFGGDSREIIGVVSDYGQESLKNKAVPYALFLFGGQGFYSVKMKGNHPARAIAAVQQAWEQVFPHNPLHYFFLEEAYHEQYLAEDQFLSVFTLAASLLLFIACIGLFGLLAFITNSSLKDISIRKIFGASQLKIWLSLYKPFFLLLLLSMALAVPVTYFLIAAWLENFAIRIAISPMFFVLPSLLVWAVSLAVIGIYFVKISYLNPAGILKQQ